MHKDVPSYQLYGEKPARQADFWLHCETIPERTILHNWAIAAHRHDAFFQLFHLTEGSGEITTGSRIERFAAPCMLFIPPGHVHGFRFERGVDGLVVTALADRLQSLTRAEPHLAGFAATVRIVPLESGNEESAHAANSMARIAREMAGRFAGRTMLLEALMVSTVVALARIGKATGSGRGELHHRDRQRMDALEALIGAHFRYQLPVAFYAGRLGVSPTHLNRLARRETGLSVQALVGQRLLDAARRDLIFTPAPVQAIAYSLGFSDPAYFNRFFRRRMGRTPGAFRRDERMRLAV